MVQKDSLTVDENTEPNYKMKIKTYLVNYFGIVLCNINSSHHSKSN